MACDVEAADSCAELRAWADAMGGDCGCQAPRDYTPTSAGGLAARRCENLPPGLAEWLEAIERKLDTAIGSQASQPPRRTVAKKATLQAGLAVARRRGYSNSALFPETPSSPADVAASLPEDPPPDAVVELPGRAACWSEDSTLGPTEGCSAKMVSAAAPSVSEGPQPLRKARTKMAAKNSAAGVLRSVTGATVDRDKVKWQAQHEKAHLTTIATHVGLQERLDWMMRAKDRAARFRGPGYDFVHSSAFQLTISGIILAHSLLTGISADNSLKVVVWGAPHFTWLDSVEILFSTIFIFELLARAATEQIAFFVGPQWRWNLFDTFLVALSIFDMITGTPSGGQVNSMNIARILRLARFARLLRMSRVMKQLHSLRVIMFALLDSMSSLVWCFVFIGFTMYVFAVLIVYGVAEYVREGGEGDAGIDAEMAMQIKEWWGGLYRAMITFYMAITGGADWSDPVAPLKTIHPIYEPLFIFYIFFMYFGVLNVVVVVGAFVATSQQIAADDREAIIRCEMERLNRYTEKIKAFFHEADVDDSGTLSWEEFRAHLDSPKVKAYFQSLDIDVSQAHMLFELLDMDGSNQVTVDEFLDGCMRLKGQARSIDLNMLLFMCRKVFTAILSVLDLEPEEGMAGMTSMSSARRSASFLVAP